MVVTLWTAINAKIIIFANYCTSGKRKDPKKKAYKKRGVSEGPSQTFALQLSRKKQKYSINFEIFVGPAST